MKFNLAFADKTMDVNIEDNNVQEVLHANDVQVCLKEQ